MNVIEVNVADIKPYPNNPRINDDAISMVAVSIQEFGFQVPIILDNTNIIVAGHSRWLAAKSLKLDKVPAIYVTNLTEAQIKAFRIMDNKAAEQSKWNFDKLAKEIESLEKLNCNMDSIGFDLLDIEKIKWSLPEFTNGEGQTEESFSDSGEKLERDETLSSSNSTGNPVIQYNLIFNTEEEQQLWYSYLRMLKSKYPTLITISERIVKDLQERENDSL